LGKPPGSVHPRPRAKLGCDDRLDPKLNSSKFLRNRTKAQVTSLATATSFAMPRSSPPPILAAGLPLWLAFVLP
jgi:hypothetical protein